MALLEHFPMKIKSLAHPKKRVKTREDLPVSSRPYYLEGDAMTPISSHHNPFLLLGLP